MAWRGCDPLLIASRQFPRGDMKPRNVVFVHAIDRSWLAPTQERTGMIIRIGRESSKKKPGGEHLTKNGNDIDIDDNVMEDLILHSVGRKIIWGDLSGLNDWNTGESSDEHQLFTLIVN